MVASGWVLVDKRVDTCGLTEALPVIMIVLTVCAALPGTVVLASIAAVVLCCCCRRRTPRPSPKSAVEVVSTSSE